ncbi:hypothetical protein EIM20_28625 [Pseudomonas aeruginosa]|nr:hypothetical protein EIM20_28625 [Pseudomonas aeruginosa]
MDMEDKVFTLLFSNEVKGTEIARLTGLSESGIYQVKRGERNYMNFTLKTGKILSNCFDKLERENRINRQGSYEKAIKNFYTRSVHMDRT